MKDNMPYQLEEFAQKLKKNGRMPATIESYSRDVRRFLEYVCSHQLKLSEIDPEYLRFYGDYLRHELHEKENSVRRAIIAIRQFYRYVIQNSDHGNGGLDEAIIPKRHDKLPLKLSQDQVSSLIKKSLSQHTTYELINLRNALIICLLAYEGLKASELVTLRWCDYLGATPASLKIHGPKSRIIILRPQSSEILASYLTAHRQFMSSNYPDIEKQLLDTHILVAFQGRESSIFIPSMTRHGLKFILYELGALIGVPRLNTEMLRHHAIEYLLRQGLNTAEVMKHLGLKQEGIIAKHAAILRSTQPSL